MLDLMVENMSQQMLSTAGDTASVGAGYEGKIQFYSGLLPVQDFYRAETKAEVIKSPSVLSVKLESETDWPVVVATALIGIASICATFLVGYFAYKVQQNQIKATAANFRHEWRSELREKVSEYISKIAIIHYKVDRDSGYLNSAESDSVYGEVIRVQASISLMLNHKKKLERELVELMVACDTILKSGKMAGLTSEVNKLNEKANEVLDTAWLKMKEDVGLKRAS
ncbi:hypothetical protein [Pseudomonas sp. A2]|uniref:hypothetical protein n=1 Tax=Pseudomonas sp. A2 TaxID=107445 RepID=UPI001FFEAFFD|nr:hypothetical protein [Pseudomonas sp. A2]UPK86851.1 hypothetical protein E5221_18515 [Pseudomonas sp. A2]